MPALHIIKLNLSWRCFSIKSTIALLGFGAEKSLNIFGSQGCHARLNLLLSILKWSSALRWPRRPATASLRNDFWVKKCWVGSHFEMGNFWKTGGVAKQNVGSASSKKRKLIHSKCGLICSIKWRFTVDKPTDLPIEQPWSLINMGSVSPQRRPLVPLGVPFNTFLIDDASADHFSFHGSLPSY